MSDVGRRAAAGRRWCVVVAASACGLLAVSSGAAQEPGAAPPAGVHRLLDRALDEDLPKIEDYYGRVGRSLPKTTTERAAPPDPSLTESVRGILRRLEGEAPPAQRTEDTLASLSRSAPAGPRDPFAPTPRIMSSDVNGVFVPSRFSTESGTNSGLPQMHLRGLVRRAPAGAEAPSGAVVRAMALIEIEGVGVHAVHAGDTIGIQFGGLSDTIIRVVQINRNNVVVEAGTFGQMILLQ